MAEPTVLERKEELKREVIDPEVNPGRWFIKQTRAKCAEQMKRDGFSFLARKPYENRMVTYLERERDALEPYLVRSREVLQSEIDRRSCETSKYFA